ncbi:MAG: helix-turn-helix domain-containing protein [Myxococcota bacterium]|nr:helix-turn-helix domain-containing protein [Myxococcota bacterium]
MNRRDSVFAALEVIPDRWSALVLREAFFGVRRFSDFRRSLGIARNTLTDRLNRLVEQGVLEKRRIAETNEWEEYRLTEMGLDLYPVTIALMQWGDRWRAPDGPPLLLAHRECGGELALELSCVRCGTQVDARNANYEPGPGAAGGRDRRSGKAV